MKEFICFMLGAMGGGLFGVTAMCLMQINRLSDSGKEN